MPLKFEIKISQESIRKSLYQCDPPYTRRACSHRVLYLKLLSSYNICIIYLHVIEACLKVTIDRLYFCQSKNPWDVTKNIFNSISKCSWKKKFLVKKYKKQKRYRENKSLFLDVIKNGHIFPSKVCHFQYNHRFLFGRAMEN